MYKNSKKPLIILIIFTIALLSFFIFYPTHSTSKTSPKPKNIVSAYLRVKNEIKTIEACLNSIDNIFDHIVIIHSNEKDDGTISFMNQWCKKRKYCEIHEYPYEVIPSHDKRYSENFKPQNSLASYYNFGLQFFEPEEWIVKIDADQVYIKPLLKEFLQQFKEGKVDETMRYGLTGYNTYVLDNHIFKYGKGEINGGMDSFIIKRKNIVKFQQGTHYEQLITKNTQNAKISSPVWFHFLKQLKTEGIIRELHQATPEEIKNLSNKEQILYETYIKPLLINSPYYYIKFD